MLYVRNQRAPLPVARVTAADPPPAVTDDSARAARPRDPYFDNAKYLAIVLVAIGHAWTPLRDDSRAIAALYLFVYAFHMPAFIMIAGHFSRGFTGRPDQLKRLITGIGVPYLLFEIAYILFKRWGTDDPDYPFSLLDPYYVTWFLIALFVWRLTSPIWRIVRWPVPVALGIAALATLSPALGDDLNIQRVLQFLPFFVLGLQLRREHFERVRADRRLRAAGVPVLVAALGVAYWVVPRMDGAWLYRSDSARELGAAGWVGVLMGLALFGIGLLLTACFLAWVPGRRQWFTSLGAGTMYGYLLHGFIAKGSRWWDWYEADWVNSAAGQVVVTAIGAVAVTLLCTSPVRRAFRFLVEPSLDWAFKQDAVARGAGRSRKPAHHHQPVRS